MLRPAGLLQPAGAKSSQMANRMAKGQAASRTAQNRYHRIHRKSPNAKFVPFGDGRADAAPLGRRENKSQLVTRFGHGAFNNSKGLPSQSSPPQVVARPAGCNRCNSAPHFRDPPPPMDHPHGNARRAPHPRPPADRL